LSQTSPGSAEVRSGNAGGIFAFFAFFALFLAGGAALEWHVVISEDAMVLGGLERELSGFCPLACFGSS
jgi:hypothetical protein